MIQTQLNNKVKLIDFGVSKIAQHTATFTSRQIGTMVYMPPEAFDIDPDAFANADKDVRPVPVSAKSDIWAVGCLISEIFSGVKPWSSKKGESRNDTYITKKLSAKSKFPIPNTLDADIKIIVEAATSSDPNDRPSAGELKTMVEKLRTGDK